jgi:hypothetical protein
LAPVLSIAIALAVLSIRQMGKTVAEAFSAASRLSVFCKGTVAGLLIAVIGTVILRMGNPTDGPAGWAVAICLGTATGFIIPTVLGLGFILYQAIQCTGPRGRRVGAWFLGLALARDFLVNSYLAIFVTARDKLLAEHTAALSHVKGPDTADMFRRDAESNDEVLLPDKNPIRDGYLDINLSSLTPASELGQRSGWQLHLFPHMYTEDEKTRQARIGYLKFEGPASRDALPRAHAEAKEVLRAKHRRDDFHEASNQEIEHRFSQVRADLDTFIAEGDMEAWGELVAATSLPGRFFRRLCRKHSLPKESSGLLDDIARFWCALSSRILVARDVPEGARVECARHLRYAIDDELDDCISHADVLGLRRILYAVNAFYRTFAGAHDRDGLPPEEREALYEMRAKPAQGYGLRASILRGLPSDGPAGDVAHCVVILHTGLLELWVSAERHRDVKLLNYLAKAEGEVFPAALAALRPLNARLDKDADPSQAIRTQYYILLGRCLTRIQGGESGYATLVHELLGESQGDVTELATQASEITSILHGYWGYCHVFDAEEIFDFDPLTGIGHGQAHSTDLHQGEAMPAILYLFVRSWRESTTRPDPIPLDINPTDLMQRMRTVCQVQGLWPRELPPRDREFAEMEQWFVACLAKYRQEQRQRRIDAQLSQPHAEAFCKNFRKGFEDGATVLEFCVKLGCVQQGDSANTPVAPTTLPKDLLTEDENVDQTTRIAQDLGRDLGWRADVHVTRRWAEQVPHAIKPAKDQIEAFKAAVAWLKGEAKGTPDNGLIIIAGPYGVEFSEIETPEFTSSYVKPDELRGFAGSFMGYRVWWNRLGESDEDTFVYAFCLRDVSALTVREVPSRGNPVEAILPSVTVLAFTQTEAEAEVVHRGQAADTDHVADMLTNAQVQVELKWQTGGIPQGMAWRVPASKEAPSASNPTPGASS